MTVQFQRRTDALIKHLGQYAGQELHSGFKLRCHLPDCDKVYQLIPTLEGWPDVTEGCAETAVRWALEHPNMTRGESNRKQLAWLLARVSLRRMRKWHHEDKAKKTSKPHTELYLFINDKMTFDTYKVEICEPVAEDLMARMVTRVGDCPNCRVMTRSERGCGCCKQSRCPIHCKCTKRRG